MSNKLKTFNNKQLFQLFLLFFGIRAIIFATPVDGILMLIFSAAIAWIDWLERGKIADRNILEDRLKALEMKLSTIESAMNIKRY